MAQTVIIVGAGASTEFSSVAERRMPVGEGLAAMIRARLTSDLANWREDRECPLVQALQYQSIFNGNIHPQAMERIRVGIVGSESIDDFVNEWEGFPGVKEVAKVAIAYSILAAESQTDLAQLDQKVGDPTEVLAGLRNSWLGRLLRFHNAGHSMRRSFIEGMSDLAFVTFNYDRTIEWYLWNHLTRTLAVPKREARELIARIPIIHVYGSLGLPAELGGNTPFGVFDPHRVANAAARLQTYCETIDTNHAGAIAGVIEQAKRHIFLGAAFHPQNMRLIYPLGNAEQGVEGWATVMGIGPRRKGQIREAVTNNGGTFTPFDGPAARLFQDHHDDLFD